MRRLCSADPLSKRRNQPPGASPRFPHQLHAGAWRLTLAAMLTVAALFAWAVDVGSGQTPPPESGDNAGGKVPAFPGSELFNGKPPFLANVSVDHANLEYKEGDLLSVQFQAEREAHLYLIYHQADGKSLLLFPNEAQPANRISAKQQVTIPGANDEFRIRILPPFGVDVLQVVATLKPIAELDALVQKTGKTPIVSAEALGKVRDALLKDLTTWTEHRVPIATVAKSEPTAKREPARFMLLVGIDTCQDETIAKPRPEFRHSAEMLAAAFKDRGQLAPDGIKVLLGKDATRANFETAITQGLASATQPGDTVFIGFCGYGGLMKNPSGDSSASPKLFLMPHDNALPNPSASAEETLARVQEKMITTETWLRWAQALPGRRIVLILDLCLPEISQTPPAGTTAQNSPNAATRLKDLSNIEISVVQTWCIPQPAYFSGGDKPTTWTAHFLSEAMTKLPPAVTLVQAAKHLQEGWNQKLAGQNCPLPAPTLNTSSPDSALIELVPAK